MAKARILAVPFRTNPSLVEREQQGILRAISDFVEPDFVSALDTNIDWNYPEVIVKGYRGIIFGGSGDLDFDGGRPVDDPVRVLSYEILGRLRPLFTYIFDRDIPTLGICYGHQMVGAFAGAQIYSDPAKRKLHRIR